MRVVGHILNEHLARRFCAHLQREGIASSCEMDFDSATGHMSYAIWVHDEDQLKAAAERFGEFEKSPQSTKFDVPILEQLKQSAQIEDAPPEELIVQPQIPTPITSFFLALCAFLFFWNTIQEFRLESLGAKEGSVLMTPVQEALLYDVPPAFEKLQAVVQKYSIGPEQKLKELPQEIQVEMKEAIETPYWKGAYEWLVLKLEEGDPSSAIGPAFVKIKEGEIWRLFSPAVLHVDFLHILFNMIWLWVLGRPIEQRIGPFRLLLLTLMLGVFANTIQYMMSGPFFMGYSGIVLGLAGFIWMRERVAPWEGYPLDRATILFLVLFVLAMAALQIGALVLSLFTSVQFYPRIANSAHIAGALLGAFAGRFSYFAMRNLK